MKIFRRVIIGLVLLLVVLLAVPSIFVALGIPINLAWLRGPLGSMASTALQRDVSIEGSMRLVPGLSPTFEVRGVQIAEPGKPDEGDEARVGFARVQLSLPSILEGNIRIQEITAEDIQVAVTLGRDRPVTEKAVKEIEPGIATTPSETETEGDAPRLGFKELNELALRRIVVQVREATTGRQHRFELTELTGAATADEPMTLTARGSYQEQPFHLDMKGGSVSDLLLLSLSWPLDMSAEFAGVKMRLAPTRQADTSSTDAKLDYTLAIEGQRFDTLDKVAGVSLPPLGPYAVGGRFGVRGKRYSISDFAVRVGESKLYGSFELDLSGELPRADIRLRSEALHLDDFDVGDWSPVTGDDKPVQATQAQQSRDRDRQEVAALLSPEALKRVSAHFSLIIESVLSEDEKLGGGVIELNLEDGRLVLDPFRIELPAGPAELTLIVDAATSEGIKGSHLLPEKVSAMIAGTSVDITRISDEPATDAGAPDTPWAIRYRMHVKGESLDRFDKYAGVSLPPLGPYELRAEALVRETEYSLPELEIRVGKSDLGGTLVLETGATRPRVDVRLASKNLQLNDFLFEDWSPLGASTDETAGGQADREKQNDGQDAEAAPALLSPEVMHSLDAHFSLEMARVLSGEERLGGGKIALALEDGRLTLDPLRINLPAGPIDLNMVVDSTTSEGIVGSHLLPETISAKVAGTTLEIARIPGEPGTPASAPDTPWDIRYRMHVKGQSLDRFDKFAGVSLPPLGPYELRAEALARQTTFAIPELDIRIAESDLGGELTLDTSGRRPRIDVNLASKNFQLNDFVFQDWSPLQASPDETAAKQTTREKGPEGQDDEAIRAMLSPKVMGSLDALFSLEMAQVLSGKKRLGGGKIKLALEDGRITLDPLRINLPPGPIDVHMVVDSTAGAGFEGSHLLPVSISGKVAGTSLTLTRVSGESEKGDGSKGAWNVRYRMKVKGESLERFDKFAGVLLPPLGPYELRTDINARDTHYSLTGLDIRVGESDLQGEMTLDTDGLRPRAEVRLTTDRLQLEDFIFEDWSPQEGAGEQDEKKPAAELDEEEIKAILAPEVMRRLDALLSVKVKRVLLGEESFGGGVLKANLKDGRLDIDPIRVEIPGGSVAMNFGLEPTDRDLAAQIGLKIEKFDYGILARRTRPETDMGGLISLDVDIDSRAEQGRDLMRDANGHIKFGIWPQNIEADLFDLWAVNLLTAILPSVDQGPRSKVNCVVARYKLEDGRLTQESLLMDTSNMQVGGRSEASFKTETVSVYLRPRAKRPEFFSVATPIEVNGSFSDFDVAPAPGAIAGSAVRFVTSVVTTPVQRLFRKNVPPDGEPACTIAFRGKIPMGR